MHTPTPKTGILLAAYGFSTPEGKHALEGFELFVHKKFPNIPVQIAFTSAKIRNRLPADEYKDAVGETLLQMIDQGFTHIAVLALHIIAGTEHEQMLEEVDNVLRLHPAIRITCSAPLLSSAHDLETVANALIAHIPAERAANEAVIWLGHGSRHTGAQSYAILADIMQQKDRGVFVGTLEGKQTLASLLPALKAFGATTIWLLPLFSLVGKHAQNDMAGSNPNSWQSLLELQGFICKPLLKGTAEYHECITLWIKQLENALLLLQSTDS